MDVHESNINKLKLLSIKLYILVLALLIALIIFIVSLFNHSWLLLIIGWSILIGANILKYYYNKQLTEIKKFYNYKVNPEQKDDWKAQWLEGWKNLSEGISKIWDKFIKWLNS